MSLCLLFKSNILEELLLKNFFQISSRLGVKEAQKKVTDTHTHTDGFQLYIDLEQ